MEMSSMKWPMWWRLWILANISVYTTMGNFYSACVSPLLLIYSKQFEVSLSSASHLATYAVLVIGLSNILAISVSQYISKRYTIIISMIVFLAVNIWTIYITDYNTFLASRLVGGLAAGIVEALGPLIVAECFPETHLASAMVAYTLALGAGASIGPLVAGLVFNATGNWPWMFKITTIIISVNLLSCILMLPETVASNFDEREVLATDNVEKMEKSDTENMVQVERIPSPALFSDGSLYQLWFRRSFYWSLPDTKPEANFFVLILKPFQLLLSPAVALLAVTVGLMIAFTVIASLVLSSTLQAPPNLWSPLKVGLLNLSTLVGLIIGIPVGGILADVLSRRSARRNDGSHVRESRIPAVLLGAIVTPIGVLLIGVCLQKNLGWVGMAFGWMMLSIGLTSVVNVQLTYAVDCYPWRAGHVGVVLNVVKNLLAFAIGYGVIPWLVAVGPEKQFGTMAGILWFVFLFNIPLYYYGPACRQWSLRFVS